MRKYASPFVLGLSISLLAATGPATAGDQGAGSAPAPAQIPQTQVLRSGATTVLVDVYPQRDGRIVEDLTAADFQVFEDGKPQRIELAEFVRVAPHPPDAARRDPNGLREMYAFAANPRNRVFVAFLDEFHTTLSGSNAIRQPLLDLIEREIGRDDLVGLMTPRMRPRDLTLGRERLVIEEQLTRYWTWGQRQRITTERADPMEDALKQCFHERFTGSTIEPWLVDEEGVQRYLDELLIERRREDQALRSLGDLVEYLGGLREARTTLILISDGWVLFGPNRALANEMQRDSRFGGGRGRGLGLMGTLGQATGTSTSMYAECAAEFGRLLEIDSPSRLREVITLANRSNVSIYPVATTGLAAFDSALNDRVTATRPSGSPVVANRDARRLGGRVSALRTIAENTDGIAVVQTNDLAAGMRRITDDASAYYLLAYSPANPRVDGGFRKIEVKMNTPGLSVRARRGYFAREAGGPAALADGSTSPAGAVPAEAALASLPRVSPSAEIVTYGREVNGQIAVVVELVSRAAASAEWRGGAAVSIEVMSGGTATSTKGQGEIAPGSRGALVRVPAGPSPGPWSVRVQVTKNGLSIDERLNVAAGTGVLLGGPIAFRATPSPRSPLLPVADFQFRRGERLRVEWPVLQPVDQRSARLLDRRGQPLGAALTVTEREVDGQRMIGTELNLALAEGEYLVEITGGRGADLERRLAAFRVVR